jgi:hypothetical protein
VFGRVTGLFSHRFHFKCPQAQSGRISVPKPESGASKQVWRILASVARPVLWDVNLSTYQSPSWQRYEMELPAFSHVTGSG